MQIRWKKDQVLHTFDILRNLLLREPTVPYFQQQDATEVKRTILNHMTNEFEQRFPKQISPIQEIFNGQATTTYLCKNCGTRKTSNDLFDSLQIGVQCDRIEEEISQLFDDFDISDYKCKCNTTPSLITATTRITTLPRVITIEVKRFTNSDNVKIIKKMVIPSYLTLNDSQGPKRFKFVSGVAHLGSDQSAGHYIAFADQDGSIILYNDHLVYRPSANDLQIIKENTYMLLYEQSSA